MKKMVTISLALVAVCGALFAATTNFRLIPESEENLSQNLRVVKLHHLTNDELNEVMRGEHPEMVVEFPAQTTLPFNFFLKGDLVNLIGNEGNFGIVEIKQTFYARDLGEGVRFSTNLTEWKPFLEFITGNASLALTIQEGQPTIVLGAEVNHRSH